MIKPGKWPLNNESQTLRLKQIGTDILTIKRFQHPFRASPCFAAPLK
jgi:hypothetical protein